MASQRKIRPLRSYLVIGPGRGPICIFAQILGNIIAYGANISPNLHLKSVLEIKDQCCTLYWSWKFLTQYFVVFLNMYWCYYKQW